MQKISFDKIIDLSYNVDENSPRELPIDPVNIYHTATIEKDGYFESRVDLSGHCSTSHRCTLSDVRKWVYCGRYTYR